MSALLLYLIMAVLPLGSIAGTGALFINGANVAAAGVLSWPVVSGDQLLAEAPAVLLIKDSRVFLESGTRVKITQQNGRVHLNLLAGKLYFRLAPTAPLDLNVLFHPVALGGARQGALALQKFEPGADPPSLRIDAARIVARFPYAMGLPGAK